MQSDEQKLVRAKGKEFTYMWHIMDFRNIAMFLNHGQRQSPVFDTSNVGEKVEWILEITNSPNNYLEILLGIVSTRFFCEKTVHVTLSIVDNKNKERNSVQRHFFPQYGKKEQRKFVNFAEKYYILNNSNEFLLNGNLIIKCKMFFINSLEMESQLISLQKNKFCNCNLKHLFETKKLSDFTLIVGAQKFKTHKCILAAQSKVFSAMFEHDMKEKCNNKVNIDDIKPQVIEEMLQYIYGEKSHKFHDPLNLLIVADKYEIDELKKVCEEQLVNNINTENVGKMLVFADRYKANILKKGAIQFIYAKPKEINLEQFKKDVESYSPLVIDMLHGLR